MIGPLLPPERGRWARPAGDNRLFLNGMLHVLRTGCPWRDMHERYGNGTRFMSGFAVGPNRVCGMLCCKPWYTLA
ncbi:transposase [Gluconobacter wancherniae]|nr:transposase [Gluconobacter wancherniae]